MTEKLDAIKGLIKKIKVAAFGSCDSSQTESFITGFCDAALLLIAKIETEIKITPRPRGHTFCPCNGMGLMQITGDIYFCKKPKNKLCKKCTYYGVTPLIALGNEIEELEKRVFKLEVNHGA